MAAPAKVDRVLITGCDTPLAIGAKRRLSAQVVGPNGKPIAGAAIVWGVVGTTPARAVVIADPTGGGASLTPLAPGTVTLTATSRGVTGKATLTVQAAVPAPTPTPAIAISVSPSTVAPEQGGTASATVTLTRTGGYTGAVTVAVTGLSTGVTASALTFGVGVTNATLTLTAASDAHIGNATLTLTASGAGVANATATLALSVTAATGATGGSGGGVGVTYVVPTLTWYGTLTPPTYPRPATPAGTAEFFINLDAPTDGTGSSASPWNTLTHIVGSASGVTYWIQGTADVGDVIKPTVSGTSGAWTRIRAVAGQSATVFGQVGGSEYNAAFFSGLSYVTLEGIEIRPPATGGTSVYAHAPAVRNCSHLHLVGCIVRGLDDVSRTADVTYVDDSSDVWIDGCWFDKIGDPPTQSGNAGDAITIRGGTRVSVVRNYIGDAGHMGVTIAPSNTNPSVDCVVALNTVQNRWAGGVAINSFEDQATLRTIVEWNQFRHTAVDRNPAVLSVMCVQVCGNDGQIRRNLMYDTAGEPILLTANGFGSRMQSAIGNTIEHNTAIRSGKEGIHIVVQGVVRSPTPETPDIYAKVKDNVIQYNACWDTSHDLPTVPDPAAWAYDSGTAYAVWIDLYNASDFEFANWNDGTNPRLNGNIIRSNFLNSTADNRVTTGCVYYGPKHTTDAGTPNIGIRFYTPAQLATAFPTCVGNVIGTTSPFTSTTLNSENPTPVSGSVLATAGIGQVAP